MTVALPTALYFCLKPPHLSLCSASTHRSLILQRRAFKRITLTTTHDPTTAMLANKENIVLHAPQPGKANPKTPAPGKMATKTPFKIPLDDENSTVLPKTGKKGIFAGKDPSQFVTPVGEDINAQSLQLTALTHLISGPRRQALAGKTTNIKARGLAPSFQQGKTEKKQDSAVKPQRSQLVISEQAEAAVHDETDDVPEIEYMAPVPPGRSRLLL